MVEAKDHAGSIEDFCLIQVYGRCVILPGKHVFNPKQVLRGTSIRRVNFDTDPVTRTILASDDGDG